MPQVRKRRPKLGTLCVRPWQHKRRKPSASQQPRKAGSETGEAVRVPSATEPNGTPKGSTTGAEDDPAALDLQNAKAPVQATSHKFFRSHSGGGSIEGRSVDREGLSSLLVSGAGTCSGTTLSVEGLASVAWVGTLGTFSGHVIEPASRTCFGLHGRGTPPQHSQLVTISFVFSGSKRRETIFLVVLALKECHKWRSAQRMKTSNYC